MSASESQQRRMIASVVKTWANLRHLPVQDYSVILEGEQEFKRISSIVRCFDLMRDRGKQLYK